MLAALQAADLVATQVSPKYGDAHLDHLGVPTPLRPVLPIVKAAAVLAMITTANRRGLRSAVAAVLVPYYSAAVTFHVLSGDGISDIAPAAGCLGLSGALI